MSTSSSILIKNVLLGRKRKDIYIEKNLIQEISNSLHVEADHVLDGTDKAVLPGLINTHTHAAMTLLRGYGDDMKLQEWLQNKIWPIEGKLREEDVYWSAKLASLEMIKTGTTCFFDMYWHNYGTAKAVKDMGIRAVISPAFVDLFNKEKGEEMIRENKEMIKKVWDLNCERIKPALGPHALYTVSKENLQIIKEWSKREGLLIHFHLSETEKEVRDCMKNHNGKRPVEYLEEIGFLNKNLICAHSIWLNEKEIKILAEYEVKIAHCPTSNMKLASGVINYRGMKDAGLVISLGTDGAASNNNLDMFEEMKFAALLQKSFWKDARILSAQEAFFMATKNGAITLNLNAGEIKEGKLADLILVDLKRPEMTPNHNLVSNVVYSTTGSCVSDTICDGKILMQNRKVKREEEILEKVEEVVEEVIGKRG
jgi:5-methylthioadenosine/S-adenosylhomocysteine deaminase